MICTNSVTVYFPPPTSILRDNETSFTGASQTDFFFFLSVSQITPTPSGEVCLAVHLKQDKNNDKDSLCLWGGRTTLQCGLPPIPCPRVKGKVIVFVSSSNMLDLSHPQGPWVLSESTKLETEIDASLCLAGAKHPCLLRYPSKTPCVDGTWGIQVFKVAEEYSNTHI